MHFFGKWMESMLVATANFEGKDSRQRADQLISQLARGDNLEVRDAGAYFQRSRHPSIDLSSASVMYKNHRHPPRS